jgi:hypothetical protein
MNFMRANPDSDLYLVECSVYAVNQINLVTGLIGHAKIVSFYSPYRCSACEEEFESLILVPEDRNSIRELADASQPCPACGGASKMDKYPETVCQSILERAQYDIDDEVVAVLRTRLRYNVIPDLARFRAYRKQDKAYNFLKMSGSIARMPPDALARAAEGVTVIDVGAVTFAGADVTPWRKFVASAVTTASAIQLLDCPPTFLENAVTLEDLQGKIRIRTFALPYHCPNCHTTTANLVDVAPNLEALTEGNIPIARCQTCNLELAATCSPHEAMLLRQLPVRENDPELERFLARARMEPNEKLEDALVARPPKVAPKQAGTRSMYLVAGLAGLLVAGLGLVAFILWSAKDQPASGENNGPIMVIQPKPTQTFKRPDWITSDLPASAFCQDMINRISCVGVSSYRPNRTDAVAEANDAALEEMVDSIGLKITDQAFKDGVLPGYTKARNKALGALQAADVDRKSATYAATSDVVRKARKRVVEIFQASGGPAVPSTRTDWYWEEYAADKGTTEFLVFVRYDITIDQAKQMVERYVVTTQAGGNAMTTAFPSLAWQYADFAGGAVMSHAGGALAAAKIAPKHIVMGWGDQRVTDAPGLAKMLDDWQKSGGTIKVTVKAGEAPPQVIDVKR